MRHASLMHVLSLCFVVVLAFCLRPAQAQTLTTLHSFSGGNDGATPSSLTAGGSIFYGTTQFGGQSSSDCMNGCGTVFQLKHAGSGWLLTPIYSFQGHSTGFRPMDRFIFGPDGALYGTTSDQNTFTGYPGELIRLRPQPTAPNTAFVTWLATILFTFDPDGSYAPQGDLLFDPAGNVFGTALGGGTAGTSGSIYKLTPTQGGWSGGEIYAFGAGGDGGHPSGGLVRDSAGNLYGVCYEGGIGFGTVIKLSPAGSGWGIQILHTFTGGEDGGKPLGGLLIDAAGNLFGTTTAAGTGSTGTVFEISPLGQGFYSFTTLYSFTGAPNGGPTDKLVIDGQGNLYGTTAADGAFQKGNIFELSPAGGSWTYSSLYEFTGGTDGSGPSAVTFGQDGNMYGTTSAGGAAGDGTVWQFVR
jgi:uncharacterized repeat protein (TIGR03803 family)